MTHVCHKVFPQFQDFPVTALSSDRKEAPRYRQQRDHEDRRPGQASSCVGQKRTQCLRVEPNFDGPIRERDTSRKGFCDGSTSRVLRLRLVADLRQAIPNNKGGHLTNVFYRSQTPGHNFWQAATFLVMNQWHKQVLQDRLLIDLESGHHHGLAR